MAGLSTGLSVSEVVAIILVENGAYYGVVVLEKPADSDRAKSSLTTGVRDHKVYTIKVHLGPTSCDQAGLRRLKI